MRSSRSGSDSGREPAAASLAAAVAHRRFEIFAFLLAAATLVDHVRLVTLTSPLRAATVIAALVTLRWPGSTRAVLALAVAQAIELYARLPGIDNLQMVLLLVSATMIVGFGSAAARSRSAPSGAGWLAELEPALRSVTVVVYLCTFWHKLNRDFFAAETSCAVQLYDNMRHEAWFPGHLLPAGASLAPLLIATTLAFELAIPLLLLTPRSARLGIVAALAFHYLLGLARFYEFSVFALALLFLFAPLSFTGELEAWWRARDRRRIAAGAGVAVFALGALGAFQIVTTWSTALPVGRNVRFAGHLLLAYGWWLSAAPLAVAAYLLLRSTKDSAPPRPRFVPPRLVLLASPLLALLNGLSPYLGFKTESSFAMYSNLRTEGGRTNHFVISRPAALAPYQTDLVRILDSSDAELAAAARDGRPVPFFEIRRRVHDTGEASPPSIVYERGDTVRRLPADDFEPALAQPPSYWERKLLSFREVHSGRVPCGH